MSAGEHARPSQPLGGGENRRATKRNGKRLNIWVHDDAAEVLSRLVEVTGRTEKEVVERALYDAWFFHEAQEEGDSILLFNKGHEPQYREVVLNVRRARRLNR